jgi:ATP-binding cassette subfamily C (CFTR/MRP) protein 1
VDQALPIAAFTTLFDVLNSVAETALIASGAQYVAAIIPLGMIVVCLLQNFYLRTSRQLRFLDLETKSPLYTHFRDLQRISHNSRLWVAKHLPRTEP